MPKEHREDELQNEESWDWDAATSMKPGRKAGKRTVVSVAFNHSDFELVSIFAEQAGKKLSEFIREAAVEKATGEGSSLSAYVTGSAYGMSVIATGTGGFTRVNAAITYEDPKEALTS